MVNRLALVTGATSGIGKAISELFAKKGINLIISGRNLNELLILKDDLSKLVDVKEVQADLSDDQDRQKLVHIIHENVPDILINNAGFGLYGEALVYSTGEQLKILDVNGKAVLELTLEAARSMISHSKKGIILNVSSAAGFQVFPNMAVYAASKAFVSNFSQALDFEFKSYGIRVLTLCPGMVATNFQKRGGSTVEQHHGMMTSSFIADQIWNQIEQLNRMRIVDWKYRIMTHLSKLLPTGWISPYLQKIIAKRITSRPILKS